MADPNQEKLRAVFAKLVKQSKKSDLSKAVKRLKEAEKHLNEAIKLNDKSEWED